MVTEIQCPTCGSVEWKAIEQFTSLTPCRIGRDEDGEVITDFDMRAEFQRDASTSVTTGYICAEETCGYMVEPHELHKLGG